MILFYVEGSTVVDSAAFLGISEDAIKQRLRYGRSVVGDRLWKTMEAPGKNSEDRRLLSGVFAALPFQSAPWLEDGASTTSTKIAPARAAMAAAGLVVILLFVLFKPEKAGTAGLRVRIVYESQDTGGPVDTPVQEEVRLASQPFSRGDFYAFLDRYDVDKSLGDNFEMLLLDRE